MRRQYLALSSATGVRSQLLSTTSQPPCFVGMMRPPYSALIFAIVLSAACLSGAASERDSAMANVEAVANKPEVIEPAGKLRLEFGEARIVLPRGLQPSMLATKSGSIILQAQIPEKPFPSKRITYFSALATRVSRDGGLNWSDIPLKRGENGVNMEGGILQLRDGTILALDTYIMPGERPEEGIGQLYTSHDDWRTVQGPTNVVFELPGVDFYGSSDDGGR